MLYLIGKCIFSLFPYRCVLGRAKTLQWTPQKWKLWKSYFGKLYAGWLGFKFFHGKLYVGWLGFKYFHVFTRVTLNSSSFNSAIYATLKKVSETPNGFYENKVNEYRYSFFFLLLWQSLKPATQIHSTRNISKITSMLSKCILFTIHCQLQMYLILWFPKLIYREQRSFIQIKSINPILCILPWGCT